MKALFEKKKDLFFHSKKKKKCLRCCNFGTEFVETIIVVFCMHPDDQIHEQEQVWQEIVANNVGNCKCLPMVLVYPVFMFSFFILCTYVFCVLT